MRYLAGSKQGSFAFWFHIPDGLGVCDAANLSKLGRITAKDKHVLVEFVCLTAIRSVVSIDSYDFGFEMRQSLNNPEAISLAVDSIGPSSYFRSKFLSLHLLILYELVNHLNTILSL